MMRALMVIPALITPLAAFSPVLHLVNPRGGQIGTEMEVNFHGERLGKIHEAILYQPGITITSIEAKDAKHLVAKLAIAPDAALGEHSLRLRGSNGLTELRSFWVGQFPNIPEAEPNATLETAQRVELNRTVNGIASNEDEDYYVCSMKKGQRLSVEVEAMRLGRVMFDSYLAIFDPKGSEIVSCDDTPLLRTDSFASIIAEEDGDYRILVREAAYEGNENCQYRLHIGSFPRPSAVFPTGGKPGETLEFTFPGDPSGPIRQSIRLPDTANARFPVFPIHNGQSAPSPHWITLSGLDSVIESGTGSNVKTATPMPPLPSAAHGVIGAAGESDWFGFSATKDQNLVIRVLARSHRSPLDSVLSLHSADGKSLANNDDQGSPDSVIQWTCPADGTYALQIRDQLGRGGPDFTYRIEVAPKSPTLAATLPIVERVNSQKWKTFPIPRGNRYAAVVNLSRENIACDSVFEAESLPSGVMLTCPPIPRSLNNFPVVFEAAADAEIAGGLHAFSIRSTGDAPAISGALTDTIHHVDVNNQGAYHSASFDRIAMAVTEEAPFKIDLVPPAIPIVQNGTLGLTVRVTRSEGYAEKITVRFLWNPPGISGPVTLDLPGDQSEVSYELNATKDAVPATWQVCVLAEAKTAQGPVLVSSALTPLTVAEPYVAMTLDLAAAEQGSAATMLGKIENRRPFKGTATVELIGLPHGASCPPQAITADQTEITFPLAIAADAMVGKHNGLFCRITVPENGATILHQTAMNSTLRIDAAAAAAPKADPKPVAAQPKPEDGKPLSRLEQLRQRGK